MIERLKCCVYIMLAKQYAVFTADRHKVGKHTSCNIKGDKIFLAAVTNYLKKVADELHSRAEAIENELK